MRYDGHQTSRGDGLAKGSSTGDFRRARPRYGAVDLRCGGRSALGYDLNTVEFAVEAGVPYAIDFMNPAPDADFYSVGQDNFHWIVDAVASLAIEKARTVSGTSDQIRCLSLLNGEPGITKQLQAAAATSPTGQGISAAKSRTPAKKMEASATAPPAKKSFSPKYAARPHSRNDQTVTRQSKSAESGALSRPGNAMRPASRLELKRNTRRSIPRPATCARTSRRRCSHRESCGLRNALRPRCTNP